MLTPQTIDILIPSRQRPQQMARVMRSIRDSAESPKNISVVFYLDDDDTATHESLQEFKPKFADAFREVQYLVGERAVQAVAYNHMSLFCNGDIIMYAADDISFNTKGWDKRVLDEFGAVKDRVMLLWCHDPIRLERGEPAFPDHAFVSRWSKNVLKYLFPVFGPRPDIPGSIGCCYTDVWLNQLYKHMGRRKHLRDVEIAHEHWHVKRDKGEAKVKIDDNYAIEAILTDWRITPEFVAHNKELPNHAALLQEWIEYVQKGGLERVEPEIRKRTTWRADAKAQAAKRPPTDIIDAGNVIGEAGASGP